MATAGRVYVPVQLSRTMRERMVVSRFVKGAHPRVMRWGNQAASTYMSTTRLDCPVLGIA